MMREKTLIDAINDIALTNYEKVDIIYNNKVIIENATEYQIRATQLLIMNNRIPAKSIIIREYMKDSFMKEIEGKLEYDKIHDVTFNQKGHSNNKFQSNIYSLSGYIHMLIISKWRTNLQS